MEILPTSLWPSWRLVYTICAFFAMVVQLCMRNATNFAILCMVKSDQNRTDGQSTLQFNSSCSVYLDQQDDRDEDILEGEFTWSKNQEWIFLSSYYYGYMIVQPIAGRLADRFGGKAFFLTGLIGEATLFMMIPSMARISYKFVVTVRLLEGFLAGFGVPSIYQLYTVWAHPSERAVLMSFAYGGYTVGSILVFPISSFLCRFGWTYVFYVIGGISFLLGVGYYWLIYSTLEAHPWITEKEFKYLKGSYSHKMTPTVPWRQMFTSCSILTFMATHILHSYGLIVLNLVLPRFFRDTMYFNLKQNGFYSSAIYLGSITSKLIVIFTIAWLHKLSKLSLTNFRRIVYCFGSICAALSFLTITALTCEQRMIIVLFIFFIGAAIDVSFTGAYWVSGIDMAPAFAGLLTGISNAASTLSGILAPLVISNVVTVGTKDEWNYLFYSIAASYIIGTIVYGTFGSSEKQQWGDFIAETNKIEGDPVAIK